MDNSAKTFLRRYRGLVARRESLQRMIDEAYERAMSCTVRPKEVQVQSSPMGDRLAEDVARITDATAQLEETKAQITGALREILAAIEAVPDETQKAVLTLRYVEGLDWIRIQEKIGYERTQTLVIHGRALWHVNRWMEGKNGRAMD